MISEEPTDIITIEFNPAFISPDLTGQIGSDHHKAAAHRLLRKRAENDPKRKFTTDRYQKGGLTPIRTKSRIGLNIVRAHAGIF